MISIQTLIFMFTLNFAFGYTDDFVKDVEKFGDFLKGFAETSLGTKYLQVSSCLDINLEQ